jgi:outer membrane immunogenic protein
VKILIEARGASVKKNVVAVVALLTASFGTPAMAADMPVKAPPPEVVWSWTGPYAGIEGGAGWGRESWLDNDTLTGCPPCFAANFRPDGGIFGGHIGWRYQFNNNIVIGVEAMGSWADLNDTISTGNTAFPGETETLRVKTLYSGTGQLGYAWKWSLLYVKGGLAGADVDWNTSAPIGVGLIPGVGVFTPFSANNSPELHGWTAGIGLDHEFWNKIVVGIEYDHYTFNYAGFSAAASNGGFPVVAISPSHLMIDSVVARLSYRFDWPPAK